ncbi:MAG: nucleoside deaminase [Magnetococcales bacterium]|nr:nucleoside deaminase [Magnetococcales bacterium]
MASDPRPLEPDAAALLLALVAAAQAGAASEVPIGATLRDRHGRHLALVGNKPLLTVDPVGHAEMRALCLAAARVGNYRLGGTHLTVTLEPCPMCFEAASLARVATVGFGINRTKNSPEPCIPVQVSDASRRAEIARMLTFFFEPKRGICSNHRP